MMFRDYQQDWAESDDSLNEANYQLLIATGSLSESCGFEGDLYPDENERSDVCSYPDQRSQERLRSFLSTGPELMLAELVLCTRPFLFCSLLRALWPTSQPQLPMLHYYSGPLFLVPLSSIICWLTAIPALSTGKG